MFDENEATKNGYDLVIKCMGYTFDFAYLKKNYSKCLAPNG
jgi:hypothetical protein